MEKFSRRIAFSRSGKYFFALLLALPACETSVLDPSEHAPADLVLSNTAVTLQAGDTVLLGAVVVDRRGRAVEELPAGWRLVWQSDDSLTARVFDGRVTGRRVGQTWVRAWLGELEDSARVAITPGKITELSLGGDTLVLGRGEELSVPLVARDLFGNRVPDPEVQFHVSDSSVAVVSAEGSVVGRSVGHAILTARAGGTAALLPVRVVRTPVELRFEGVSNHTVVRSFSVDFPIHFATEIPVSRLTFALDAASEREFSLSPWSGTRVRLNHLAQGQHALVVRAYDLFGRVRATAELRFSIDVPVRRYSLTYLGTLGGEESVGLDLNEQGEVVGWSATAGGVNHAFFWSNGQMTDIGALFDGESRATAVNARGEVVGQFQESCPSNLKKSFVWRKQNSSNAEDLGPCGTFAEEINDAGSILLFRNDPSQGVWTEIRQGLEALRLVGQQRPNGGPFARGLFLNERDQVIGRVLGYASAWLYPDRPPEVIPHTEYGFSYVVDLNDRGDVAMHRGGKGYRTDGGFSYGAKAQPIRPIGISGTSWPRGLNNLSQVVGTYSLTSGEKELFLWEGGVTYSVETTAEGWDLEDVTDVNDAGLILAYATSAARGLRGAVLLTPLE